MKRIIVRSLYDAFEYVMEHFHVLGHEENAVQKDTYAVLSLQDSYTGGIGFQFSENNFCKGVLTLLVDDMVEESDKTILFNEEHAVKAIEFIDKYRTEVDTLLVHCYGGQSRSVAVGAFAFKMLGGDNRYVFEDRTPNMHIYNTLEKVWSNYNSIDKEQIKLNDIELDLSPRNKPDFSRICEINAFFENSDKNKNA